VSIERLEDCAEDGTGYFAAVGAVANEGTGQARGFERLCVMRRAWWRAKRAERNDHSMESRIGHRCGDQWLSSMREGGDQVNTHYISPLQHNGYD
jgi:hypothetical protein